MVDGAGLCIGDKGYASYTASAFLSLHIESASPGLLIASVAGPVTAVADRRPEKQK